MIETASRKIRISPELMATLFTRDKAGRRLSINWGEPDEEGFYEPTITVADEPDVFDALKPLIYGALNDPEAWTEYMETRDWEHLKQACRRIGQSQKRTDTQQGEPRG